MIKNTKKLKKRLLFIYLTLIFTVFSFFTIYSFRFDVLEILHEHGDISFEIDKDTQKRIQDEFSKYEVNNANITVFKEILQKELPGYSHIVSYLHELDLEEEGASEGYSFFMYDRTPYKEAESYWNTINAHCMNTDVLITAIPLLTSYFLWFGIVAIIFSLLLGALFYLILSKGWLKNICLKFYKKFLSKVKIQHFNRLSTQMVIVNILAVAVAGSVFFTAFTYRNIFFELINDAFYQQEDFTQFVNELEDVTTTLKMNKKNKKIVETHLNHIDEYCEAYLYKEKDGNVFYAGGDRGSITERFYYNPLNLYSVDAITTPMMYTYAIPFQDQVATLLIYSYPLVQYAIPFQWTIVIVAFSLYLIILLSFIHKKIIKIKQMQEDVSVLSSGDWKHEVSVKGNDELAELGEDLNQMRASFLENMENEKAARDANKNLISAMSHDLRTPLTTLNGYLEIIQLEKGDKEKREEYIKRCLDKVEEITELSNKMFEYSLVFTSEGDSEMQTVSLQKICASLKDHSSYLKLLGYQVKEDFVDSPLFINGNEMMLKRVLNNLFSNIQKYADKQKEINICLSVEKNQMKLMMINHKKQNINHVESNGIGLKSVRKIVALHQGECYINDNDNEFMIIITLAMKEGLACH